MSLRARGVSVVTEAALVFLSLVGAFLVRLGGDVNATLEHPHLVEKGLLCVVVVLVSLYYGELYDFPARRRTELFLRVGQCMAAAAVALAVLFFVVPTLRVGRTVFILFLLFAWSALLLWRLVVLWSWGNLAGIGDRVLILGTGVSAQNVAREMLKRSPVGYRVLGFLTEHSVEVGRVLVNPSVLGTLADLPTLADKLHATVIVVAQEDRRKSLPVDALLRCRLAGVRVVEGANLLEGLSGRIPLRDLRPSWLIFSTGFHKPRVLSVEAGGRDRHRGHPARADEPARRDRRPPRAGYERGAGALPPDAGRAGREPLRRCSSSGPCATTRRPTRGRCGTPATTTRASRGSAGSCARRGSTSCRSCGTCSRGTMSFVGPRPERPHFVDKLRTVIPYYDERHGVRPGITGWAQVKFPYGSTIEDAEEKLEYDLYYVKHMSLLLDAAIVLETFKVMLLGRGR